MLVEERRRGRTLERRNSTLKGGLYRVIGFYRVIGVIRDSMGFRV